MDNRQQNNPEPKPQTASVLPPPPANTQPLPPGYQAPQYAPPPGYPPQGYPQGYPQGAYPPPPGYPYPAYPQGYPPPGYAMPPGQYPQGMPYGYPPPGMPMPYPMPGMMPAPGAEAQATPTMPMAAPVVPASESTAETASVAPVTQAKAPLPAPVSMPAPSIAAVAAPAPSTVSAPVPVGAPVDHSDAHPEWKPEDGVIIHAGDGEVFVPQAAHEFVATPKSKLREVWEKMGGGSLTFSLMVHIGLFLVAGIIIFTTTIETKNVDFLPGGGTEQGKKASQDVQNKVQNKRRQSISKTSPMKKLVANSENAAIVLPETPPDMLDVPDVSSMMGGGSLGGGGFGKGGAGGGFGTGIGMGGAAGFVSLPPSMRARCSTAERLEKLRQNGGSSECEAAVSRALEWFKTKQNADGSWGTGNKAGMTGFVLLCYLGRCETPESPFYGDNVMKGIMYLLELSKKNPDGYFTENPKAIGAAYEHGIATYALGEMYTLARLGSKSLPGMREGFEQGVKLIIDAQNEKGGWDYYTRNKLETGNPKSGRNDLSVTAWQYQALKAAKNTGLKIAGLGGAINKTVEYLESTQTKDGGFGLTERDAHYNQWSLTGAGALGLQTLAKGKTRAIDNGIKFLREFITAEPLDWNKNANLYCWYYYTQTFFQKGGDDWKFYNEQLLPQLLNNQAPDGSWKPERANWDAGSAGNREGGVYKTALCTLQLEVYYRYLKVADRDEDSFFERN